MIQKIAFGAVAISIIGLCPPSMGSPDNHHTPRTHREQTESDQAREPESEDGDFVSFEEVRPEEEEIKNRIPLNIEAPVEPTRAGGSRGCKQAQSASLTLLSPSGEPTLTGVGHPTFYWHVSETVDLPILFTLVEIGGTKAILEQVIPQTQPGLIGFKLPASVQELEVGKEYQWSVSLVCNPERPSANIVGRAWIRRVNFSSDLKQSLAAADSSAQKGEVLAQAGIWSDALAYFYQTFPSWQPWENLWRIVVAVVQPSSNAQEN